MQRHARHQRNGLAADVIPAHRKPHRTVVIDVPPVPTAGVRRPSWLVLLHNNGLYYYITTRRRGLTGREEDRP
jgi:hypothetical protein